MVTLIYTSPSPGVNTAVGDFPGLALMDLMKPYMPPMPENYQQVLRDIHARAIQMWAGCIWVPIYEVMTRKHLKLVTLEENLEMAADIGMDATTSLDEAFAEAMAKHGPDAKVVGASVRALPTAAEHGAHGRRATALPAVSVPPLPARRAAPSPFLYKELHRMTLRRPLVSFAMPQRPSRASRPTAAPISSRCAPAFASVTGLRFTQARSHTRSTASTKVIESPFEQFVEDIVGAGPFRGAERDRFGRRREGKSFDRQVHPDEPDFARRRR